MRFSPTLPGGTRGGSFRVVKSSTMVALTQPGKASFPQAAHVRTSVAQGRASPARRHRHPHNNQDDIVSRPSSSRRWRSPLFLLIAAAALLFAFLTL